MNADSASFSRDAAPTGSERAIGLGPDLESALLEGLEDAPDPDAFEDDDGADFAPGAVGDAAPLFEADDHEYSDDLTPPFALDWSPSAEPDPSHASNFEGTLVEGPADALEPPSEPPSEPKVFPDGEGAADLETGADPDPAPLFEAEGYDDFEDRAPPPAPDWSPSTEPDPPRASGFEDALLAGPAGAPEPPSEPPSEPKVFPDDEGAVDLETGADPDPAPLFEAEGYDDFEDRTPPPAPDWSPSTEPDPPHLSDFDGALLEGLTDAPELEEFPDDVGAAALEDRADPDRASPFEAGGRTPLPAPDRTSPAEPDPPRPSDFEGALLEGLADAPEIEETREDVGGADFEAGTGREPAPFFDTDGPGEAAARVRPPMPDWSPPPEADFEQTLSGPRADAFDSPGFLDDGNPGGLRTDARVDEPGPFVTDDHSGTHEEFPDQTRLPLPDWSPPTEPDLERALVEGLTDASEPDPYVPGAGAGSFDLGATAPLPPAASDFGPRAEQSPPSLADWDSPQEPDVEQALLDGLADAPEPDDELADDAEAAELDPDPGFDAESLEQPFEEPYVAAFGALPEGHLPLEEAGAPGPATRIDPFAAAGSEAAALAFATDPETESALREGLSDHADPQVWPGDLRTAIEVISAGHSSQLIFADLDETPYPAGAIHELAAVCEMGTVVVALGSNGTARFSREVLLAGVSDYLVKPVTPAAVREAAARASRPAAAEPAGGWSVGFAGTGGSGATTVAAATALVAAGRGRYVSVLDLNRTFPALSFLLDVEPAAGLVELLSTVARASLHPEMVDGMRTERSDRIAVYGYPWSAVPPPLAPVWAVCELLVELQRRSHLVLIDGLDDPASRLALLALVDTRVMVVEPTPDGAAQAAHVLERFGPMFDEEWPFVLVQNHTRGFKPAAGAKVLNGAGVDAPADVVIPYEPSLPAIADRGWPGGRLPKSVQKSVDTLADRILTGEAAAAAPVFA